MDAFDINALRVTPGAETVPTQRVWTAIPMRKPGKTEFVRVNPAPEARLPCMFYTDPDDRDSAFVVLPNVLSSAGTEIPARMVELRQAVTRGGSPFLWPVPFPNSDGRVNSWHESAASAAQLAETQWTRMAANTANGCYEVTVASPGVIPDPDWTAFPLFEEQVEIAVKERLIDTPDHLVMRKLRGEA